MADTTLFTATLEVTFTASTLVEAQDMGDGLLDHVLATYNDDGSLLSGRVFVRPTLGAPTPEA